MRERTKHIKHAGPESNWLRNNNKQVVAWPIFRTHFCVQKLLCWLLIINTLNAQWRGTNNGDKITINRFRMNIQPMRSRCGSQWSRIHSESKLECLLIRSTIFFIDSILIHKLDPSQFKINKTIQDGDLGN